MPQTTHARESVVRSQLGARLRQLREEAELKLGDAAERAGTNKSTLSRVENGLRGLKPKTAERLLECYGVGDPAVLAELLELIRVDEANRRRPVWFKRHHAILSPTRFDGYLALESTASRLRNYQPSLVPGLLQTPAYARAVIASMRPELSHAQIDELVGIRMARQRKIINPAATDFSTLIEEAALLRPVGDRTLMRQQLRHLMDVSSRPRTTVRLAPFSHGPHPGLYGPYVILSFPTATRDIVCVEAVPTSVYFEEPAEVERYASSFDDLWDHALSPDDTRARLNHMIKEFSQ